MGAADAQHLWKVGLGNVTVGLGVSMAKLAGWEPISHPQCHPNADGVVLKAALGQW